MGLPDALDGLLVLLGSPGLLALMALAIPIGMFFGAVPGLGGKTAIALAIPFVFGMEPLAGAVFLVAMHAVVHTGGSIPSILFGVPGTGPDAATVVDGHPMARRGEAGRALGASLGASALGGVVGALALALLLPLLRPVVLSFGPAEIFLLAVLGISFIGAVSGASPARGVIVGCLGLLLSFVGMDPKIGVPRFTFGQLFLWDGVDITTAVLAIFGVPEMIALGARGGSVSDAPRAAARVQVRQLIDGLRDVVRHWRLALRTSVIGAAVGVIPGLGGDVASWVCYGHAVQSARDPERFGKGAVEGVIAPETANNSKEGGALVPTLFFAVPGSSGMALLLGAFVVLGITPGPHLLLEDPGLVWTLVSALALANLLAVAFFLALGPGLGALSFVSGGRIVPVVFVVAMTGSLAVTLQWQSLLVLLVLGLLGWGLKRCGWPRAPFAIGLVLGEIAEVALHQSLTIWGATFLLRPSSLTLLALTAAGVAGFLWRSRGARPPTAAPREDAFVCAVLLALFVAAAVAAGGYAAESRLFPWLVAAPAALLCGVLLVRDLVPGPGLARRAAADPGRVALAREGTVTSWFVGQVVCVLAIGIPLGGALSVFGFLWLREGESLATSLALSLGSIFLLVLLFEGLLGVELFRGLAFTGAGAAT